jgi:hypothetical protein
MIRDVDMDARRAPAAELGMRGTQKTPAPP